MALGGPGKAETMVVALLIGAASGFIQLFLIIQFATLVTAGKLGIKSILYGILQFILPAAILIGCAFLWPENLIWAGTGIVAALLVGTIIKLVFRRHKLKGNDRIDD